MRSAVRALQQFEKARQQFHKPSCFNFSSEFEVLLFDFSPAYSFDRTY